ncbi:MAG: UPF0182 family protein [Clostridia bacterium]|nr:UPF0182 family protein [Clostridia bacterium]
MADSVTKLTQKTNKKYKTRAIIVLIFIVAFAIFSFANYRSEYLQIKEIGEEYISVFKKNITFKYTIVGVNFLIWFSAIYVTNKIIKKGLKTFFAEEKKEMPKLPNKSIALILGGLIAIFTSELLENKIMLFMNATWFGGNGDPIFGKDIGYYMFQKPFIELVLMYAIALISVLTVYTIIYYIVSFNNFFDGVDGKTLKKSVFVKQITIFALIMAICLSGFTLLKTQDVLFEEFLQIDDEQGTALVGAGFTDVTVKLWGYRLFAVVIIVGVFFGLLFLKREKYKMAIISILTIPGYLVALFLLITFFQIAFVNSSVLDTEKKYIEYNIENTKKSYGIDVDEIELEDSQTITDNDVENYQNVINNIPVVSEEMTLTTLNSYQDSVGFYKYDNTKLQSYKLQGKESIVYVSPREIMIDGSSRTYDNKTYNYTHGYGAVISYATKTNETGGVEYIQVDFSGKDEQIKISEPRIYFGLKTNSTIVVNNKDKKEFDYPITTSTNSENDYNGASGISLGFFDRLILGITKNNFNLAFIDGDCKIIMNRNIIERAKKIIPYLIYDENPYLVITEEGKMVWVLDAYTTSDSYPYSQRSTIITDNTKTKINYIRNSAKVLIDAYDGTVKFYITDRTDPIIMAYSNMYDELFAKEEDTIPEDIVEHFTYPELLYKVQAEMYQRYHRVQTEVLYRNDDLWQIARFNINKSSNGVGSTMDPYYTMVKTLGNKESIGLVIPYTSYGKQNIISYLVGTNDGENKLTLYKYKSGSNVLGPAQLNQQVEQDETISAELETLNTSGSKVVKNMIIVPIEGKLLYVEPVYQVLLNEKIQVQQLRKVIVASGNKVAIGNTLIEALNNLLSKSAVNIELESSDDEEDLINAIIKANNNLQESNDNSDWEMMGKDIKRLQDLIRQLEILKNEKSKNDTVNENLNTTTNTVLDANNVLE